MISGLSPVMYWVYILKNKNNNYYIGQTENLEQRLKDHLSGRAGWTRKRGPWELCYKKNYETRGATITREKYLKNLKNKKVIEQIIQSSK